MDDHAKLIEKLKTEGNNVFLNLKEVVNVTDVKMDELLGRKRERLTEKEKLLEKIKELEKRGVEAEGRNYAGKSISCKNSMTLPLSYGSKMKIR